MSDLFCVLCFLVTVIMAKKYKVLSIGVLIIIKWCLLRFKIQL